jgi:hypothetical protein
MQKYLEDVAKVSIANYLKILWCLLSYSEHERKIPEKFKELGAFERVIRKLIRILETGSMHDQQCCECL